MGEELVSELPVETTREKGGALEKSVEFIFQSAGFETIRNKKVAKYEVDVLARIGDRNVVIECKNMQNGTLTIRNLIHEWSSKNQIIKASKVILVIVGVNIKTSDTELASKLNIELWNESDLTDLFNLTLTPNQLRDKLLSKISFKPVSISELYREVIAEIVITPLLTLAAENEEETFTLFNHWLRAFIRTELQISGTNKEERQKHIELFEGTKEKGFFFNLFKVKRKEIEYWNKLIDRLQKESILDKATQKRYFEYMRDLKREYDAQKEYYETEDEDRLKRLIHDRLYNSLISDNSLCRFGFKDSEIVEVSPTGEGKFVLQIAKINDKQANFINWILTSEYFFSKDDLGKQIHSWHCFSLDEAAEKVFRIFDEVFYYSDIEHFRDFAL